MYRVVLVAAWLCVWPCAALAQSLAGVRLTIDGHLVVSYTDGTQMRVGRDEAGQVGFRAPQLSPDGNAAAWLTEHGSCCTSYSIPRTLVVLAHGTLHRFRGNGAPVWQFRFEVGGREIAFQQETTHGGLGIRYERREIRTERLVDEYEPAPGRAVPEWVHRLDNRGPHRLQEMSCNNFPVHTSEDELRQRFGAANVIRAAVTAGDDGLIDGTVLFPDDRDARLEVIWADESRTRMRMMTARGAFSRWRTGAGIAAGEDLLALERANGRPFRLRGFRSEAGGRVLSWSAGRLEAQFEPCLTVTLSLAEGSRGSGSLERQVIGGRELSSGHPAMQALNPRVVAIQLFYPEP
jgi:hypothetical protein